MSQRLPEEWFIEDERTNAAIAWLFAAVLALSAVGNVLAGELVTATTAVVAVVVTVVPAWVGRSWRRTIPWPLLALTYVFTPRTQQRVQPEIVKSSRCPGRLA
ncbi:hypothetical protein [Halococcus thailandensis]|uniref:Uncharacterized protein n=1 Tax=Halococcus thailandensis JCM 13552 TaxID=1227457 RepID=M0N5C4_9EURY|nr:hypothetical protein [Halococcus thailandensis]EMA53056.1 hypothetical protein C451_10185 [Halococcus thailandensis JCM 13552]